ncbi:MAG: ComF family protein [Anaerolineae bacterium]|nr:ComF family protein [Anaerolineae bacterium]
MATSEQARASAGLVTSRWKQFLQRAWSGTLDLLYPPRCAGCGRVDTLWCDACALAFSAAGPLILAAPAPLSGSVAGRWHEGLARAAIHTLKYENGHQMAVVLAAPMAEALQSTAWKFDGLVPVPLHATRLKDRGYNQAEWLAEAVASRMGVECLPNALVRTRDTPHQVGAGGAERRANMEGAFEPVGDALRGRLLILVDDVFTTGATLQACAEAALAGGAGSVFSLTATAARAGARAAQP